MSSLRSRAQPRASLRSRAQPRASVRSRAQPRASTHPLNLALRFLLELAALWSMGQWAYRSAEGWLRYALASGVPMLAATLWGVFAVPADPSRSGNAPVPVPGVARLGLEFAFFAFATWALARSGQPRAALGFGAITLLHYAVSYDRLRWLLRA